MRSFPPSGGVGEESRISASVAVFHSVAGDAIFHRTPETLTEPTIWKAYDYFYVHDSCDMCSIMGFGC